MTPRTTARPTIVRTMLPLLPALCAALAGSSDEPRFTGLSSLLPAAKATGAVSRQLKAAAGRMAWRVRIFTEELASRRRLEESPDQAQNPYRQGGGRT